MPARDWRTDPSIAAWSAFLRAHAELVRAIDRDVQRRGGMSLMWYDVLLELNAAPQRRLRMQQLGEAAVLSRTRVSRLVDELAAAGLVTREPNPADRRSSYATVTAAGRAALRRAAPVYLDAIKAHFAARLSEVQLAALRDALDALVARPEP